MSPKILPTAFYARDTLVVARNLLGKYLVRRLRDGVRAGRLVEDAARLLRESL